jgi:UDP-N-acetyl-D-glucosamine dehydrogenase
VTVAAERQRNTVRRLDLELLANRYTKREAVIGIVGLGYVGLPLALCATEAGFRVIGFDVNLELVERLNCGRSPLRHIVDARIAVARCEDRFAATSDPAQLGTADAVLICVPTPLGPHREPDLSFVENTSRMLTKVLRAGQLVVLESTTYPGTTREVVKPILETSGLQSGIDFFLAYSPEREDVSRHARVNFPRKLDEAGADAELPRFPSQIKRVDRNAVPAEARRRTVCGRTALS